MIAGGIRIPVFKVSFNGFDTHANQEDRHNELLTELSASLPLAKL